MEITPFIWTIIWNIAIAIWIIISVLIVRFVTKKLVNYVEYITATTVGLLIWIVFLWFLPKLIWSDIIPFNLGVFLLLGMFIFYMLEIFLHWHHCKDLSDWHIDDHKHSHESWNLIFIWTLLHNAFHWIILFSAFAVDFYFWVTTTVAILLHSIPQNVVNYVMNHNNFKIVLFAAFGWILGALLTYPFYEFLIDNKNYILALISWGLLYTALVDIFPSINWNANTKNKILYLGFIAFWIVLFIWFKGITQQAKADNWDSENKHIEDNKTH